MAKTSASPSHKQHSLHECPRTCNTPPLKNCSAIVQQLCKKNMNALAGGTNLTISKVSSNSEALALRSLLEPPDSTHHG